MRLIDADVLNDTFEAEMCGGCSSVCVDDYGKCNCSIHYMKELLWQQPTAYDVGKVVRELQTAPYFHGECGHIETDEAIDIVKRGGVND